MATPDPKPTKPYRASKEEWAGLRAAVIPPGTRCFCGCGRLAKSVHHLVGRDQGGDDVSANLVALAGSGTTLCHGAFQYGQRAWDDRRRVYVDPNEVAVGIRRNMTPPMCSYVAVKKGSWWLDQHYPTSSG